MSSMVLSGDTSGTITVTVPAVAGTNTVTIPAVTGTAVISGQNSAITAGTAVSSTSGTSIDFTSIPIWVKRVTVMFNGVSLSGTSDFLIRLGTGGTPTTTGYSSTSSVIYTTVNTTSSTAGFVIYDSAGAYVWQGSYIFTNLSGNTWVGQGIVANIPSTVITTVSAGSVTLSGVLNMLRITTVNGTDTFDAGSINILYE